MASAAAAAEWEAAERKVLVARKPCFGLPTACPTSLPVLLYLRLAQVPFGIHVDSSFPDADHIPYVEFGDCVAFNNEKGGVIEYLKGEKIVDLNSKHPSVSPSDVLSTKAMVSTWLADALQYELWVVNDGSIAHDIYFSDLAWPIGKILHWKKTRDVKHLLGITKLNAAEKEEEIYQKASAAYDALSLRLGDQVFLFDNSPTDVDALFLGHALFVLNALPDTSVLRGTLQKHENLVNFVEHHKVQLLEDSSSSRVGSSPSPSSSTPRKRASAGQNGEYIRIRRSTFAVLIVFAILAVGFAIAITKYLRNKNNKANEATAEESLKSSQGNRVHVEVTSRWPGLYKFTKEEIERALNYANSRIYLGSGSAGQVYQGVLPSGQLVAIKHIHKTAMSGSFMREVEQLSKVRHPNLVCLFGYCDQEGDQYLVYEYCANGNLAQNLLRSDSVLPWETRVKILRDCASVLRFLHTHPDGCIVHRDIKLTNILLTEDKVPKLSDFGLAKMLEMEETKVFTDVRGTIGYMDPEYITHSKLTCASDIYSFGVVALQLLSGRKVIELDIVARDSLTKKAKDVVNGKRPLEEFIDPRVRNEVIIEDFVLILKIAVLCVASSSIGRPTIKDVFEEMDKALRNTTIKTKARKEMNTASLDVQYARVLDV